MPGNYDLIEQIVHGDTSFPLQIYYNDIGYGKYRMECHWHEEIEILYMKSGKGIFQIDMNSVELYGGQAVFINSGSLHSGYSFSEAPCQYYSIVFHLSMISSNTIGSIMSRFINPIQSHQYKLPLMIKEENKWNCEMMNEISGMIHCHEKKPVGFELSIKASLYKIFFILISNNLLIKSMQDISSEKLVKVDRIKTILNYIYKNYQNKISLSELAYELNMSSYHLCHFFKSMTGHTPIEYINNYRINKAAELLYESRKKIIDISIEVGFDNVSYFIKTFKKVKGCTPLEYRRSM